MYLNTAHLFCVLHNKGYRHTLMICSTHSSSTATTVIQTRCNFTLYLHCLSCFSLLTVTATRSSIKQLERTVGFPLQERLRERATMVRYTYIACLVWNTCLEEYSLTVSILPIFSHAQLLYRDRSCITHSTLYGKSYVLDGPAQDGIEYRLTYGQAYVHLKEGPTEIRTLTNRNLIGHSMTTPALVYSSSSAPAPHFSLCAFIPEGNMSRAFLIFLIFYYIFKFSKPASA